MKLIRAEIIEFAAFKNRTFEFSEGLNIIEGYNESGKSTLLAFIRFMLYGFGGRSTQSGEPGERDKYLSWSGRRAAGTLTVQARGKVWRIEREGSMSPSSRGESYSEKPIQIIDAETGTVAHKGVCPGELFLGMNAAVFSATCSVAQLSAHNINSGEFGNCIENMLQSADESINVAKVCRRLEDARKELIYKNGRGGRIYELQCEAEKLSAQLTRAESNARSIMELEAEAARCREATERAVAKQNELSELWEKSEAWLILGRFERSRELDGEIEQLQKQLTSLTRDSFPDAFCPDAAYVTRLNTLTSELNQASAAATQAELRQRQHESIPTYDVSKAAIAERMTEAGQNKKSLMAQYLKLKKSITTAQMLGIMALLCGFVALVGGGLATALVSLLGLGIPLAAVGAAGVVTGAVMLGSIRKKRQAVLDLLQSISLDSDPGEAELARHIDDCLAAAVGKQNHASALDALRGVTENSRVMLSRVMQAATQALSKVGIESEQAPDKLTAALAVANLKSTEFITAQAELSRRLDTAISERDRLRESLASYDEGFIRARAARLDKENAISAAEHNELRERYTAEVRESYDRQTAVERQIAYFEGQEISPSRVSSQLELCQAEQKRLTKRAEALILAREVIEEASGKLRRGFTPTLRREASKILSPLTAERYSELGISDDFSLSLVADGTTRSVSYMSGGTRDASYLALRLALTKLLCREEVPPVLLDEALTQLDEIRAAGLLTLLGAWCDEGNQCLLFTCHTREARLAKNFKYIKL